MNNSVKFFLRNRSQCHIFFLCLSMLLAQMSQGNDIPRFSFATAQLSIPEVYVTDSGRYEAQLIWLSGESDPLKFELQTASKLSNFSDYPVYFFSDSGRLVIPQVSVTDFSGNTKFYRAEMHAVATTQPMRFEVTFVSPCDNENCDRDNDNIPDSYDFCPDTFNAENNNDTDNDGIGDACENIPDDPTIWVKPEEAFQVCFANGGAVVIIDVSFNDCRNMPGIVTFSRVFSVIEGTQKVLDCLLEVLPASGLASQESLQPIFDRMSACENNKFQYQVI